MPLVIDWPNSIVSITSPTVSVDMQTLHDFIEDRMATPCGLTCENIISPEGKIEDPSNPGVYSQIIIILSSTWQIQFWQGSGYTRIYGGKLVGGVNDQPIKATGYAGDITVLESPVDGVTVVSGSGLSTEQNDKLMGLPETTLTTTQDSKLMNLPDVTLTSEQETKLMGLPDETITEQDCMNIATDVWGNSNAVLILKILKNKRTVQKVGSEWKLTIYDDDGSTPILDKVLKDVAGSNINDLVAGAIAQELASSV